MPIFTFSWKIFFLSLLSDLLAALILVTMIYLAVEKHTFERTHAVPAIVLLFAIQVVKGLYFFGVLFQARRWITLALVGTYLALNCFVWYWMLFVIVAMLGITGITPDGTEHRY